MLGLVYDPIYLKHDTGGHVEQAQRLVSIISLLEESGIKQQTVAVDPTAADEQMLLKVHSREHISTVENTARSGGGWLDPDTVVSPSSYEAALYAAGGAVRAVEVVLGGEVDSCFALVRPPGHHATMDRALGFCLFNNIAIAARYALESIERVLIVDFDVHHGNGTQDSFYNEPRALYFSTHLYPFYPGTGWVDETGAGDGEGATVNVPLPAWCGDEEYQHAFDELLVPIAHRFQPQLIMVSAGYDAHWADPLSLMQVSVDGFARLTGILKKLAGELCGGRLVFVLEGGYHLPALSHSVKATLEVLQGRAGTGDPLGKPAPGRGMPNAGTVLQAVRRIHDLG